MRSGSPCTSTSRPMCLLRPDHALDLRLAELAGTPRRPAAPRHVRGAPGGSRRSVGTSRSSSSAAAAGTRRPLRRARSGTTTWSSVSARSAARAAGRSVATAPPARRGDDVVAGGQLVADGATVGEPRASVATSGASAGANASHDRTSGSIGLRVDVVGHVQQRTRRRDPEPFAEHASAAGRADRAPAEVRPPHVPSVDHPGRQDRSSPEAVDDRRQLSGSRTRSTWMPSTGSRARDRGASTSPPK